MTKYIHGYSEREMQRLYEQSGILSHLLLDDIIFEPGSLVLEAGCGVGAQTLYLSKNHKDMDVEIISIDHSRESINKAREKLSPFYKNVTFQVADILDLPFPAEMFDHVFICFVLEHLNNPLEGLEKIKKVLKPGGKITIIEGDHGSCFWYPSTEESATAWQGFIELQEVLGHDPLVGRRLASILQETGFQKIASSPRVLYADASQEQLLDDMVNKIILPMMKGAGEMIMKHQIIDQHTWEKGIQDIRLSGVPPEGSFFYSWFKATGIK